MKRLGHISLVVLAMSILLAVCVVPHHHHASAACMVEERCSMDGDYNDGHTPHHDDGTLCLLEQIVPLAQSAPDAHAPLSGLSGDSPVVPYVTGVFTSVFRFETGVYSGGNFAHHMRRGPPADAVSN